MKQPWMSAFFIEIVAMYKKIYYFCTSFINEIKKEEYTWPDQ